jgi:hypothetical protein
MPFWSYLVGIIYLCISIDHWLISDELLSRIWDYIQKILEEALTPIAVLSLFPFLFVERAEYGS